MTDDRNFPVDPDDIGHNDSPNPEFQSVLRGFLSRRGLLLGGVGTATTLLLGGGLAACGGDDDAAPAPPPPPPVPTTLQLNFNPVAKSLADALIVPTGYTARVLHATGDPLAATISDYTNNGGESGTSFELRAGDQHDGMNYFGLGADGRLSRAASTRGLICINYENIVQNFLHAGGPTVVAGVRTVADEVVKEINAHGVGIMEVTRADNGTVTVVRGSAFNRRITPNTPMTISGPAAGSSCLRTSISPTGLAARGTINNCATGDTPWGTFLTCEENWAFYFRRDAGDDATRGGDTAKSVKALKRYGVTQGTAGNFAWSTAVASDPTDFTFRAWDAHRMAPPPTAR